MAAGYLSTLAFATCFLAALAVLAVEPPLSHSRTLAAGLLLLGAGGAAHPLFMVWAVAVLAPALLLVAVAGRRHDGVRVGGPVRAVVIGAVVTAAAVAATGGMHASALEYSRDGMLKQTGLSPLSIPFHQDKLVIALPFLAIALASALLALSCRRRAAGWWHGRYSEPGLPPATAVFAVWIAGTLASALLLGLGVAVPAQRLAIFCLPLPMLAAIGAAEILRPRPSGWTRGSAAGRLLHVAAAMLVVGFAIALGFQGWRVEAGGSTVSHESLLVERWLRRPSRWRRRARRW